MKKNWMFNKGLATLFLIMSLALVMIGCAQTNPNDAVSKNATEDTIVDTKENVSENGLENELISEDIVSNDVISEDTSVDTSVDTSITGETSLALHVIDVGQGSSALIVCDGKYMLIDGGDREYSSTVVAYLKKQGVETLDYVIATHYDADHLNGVVGALSVFTVKQVIAPDYEATSRVYQSFEQKLVDLGIEKTLPKVGETYSLGSATFTILSPNGLLYEDYNDYSIGIRLVHGENAFVLCGDATYESEAEILNNGMRLDANVYLVDHHGSSTSSLPEFVKAIDPQYAIISCGKDNEYGHPHVETLDLLKSAKIEVHRTDLEGDIVISSDGKELTYTSEHASTGDNLPGNAQAGNDQANVQAEQTVSTGNDQAEQIVSTEAAVPVDGTEQAYVLNTNTMKFHLPTCKSVDTIKSQNRQDFEGSRDEIINMGYVPCKNCNP